MRICLIVVGKMKDLWAKQACEEYIKRLRPWYQFEILEVKDQAQLTKQLSSRSPIWVLDERGKSLHSVAFAAQLGKLQDAGTKELCLAIGGPDGFTQEVKDRAHLIVSLSPLTFPYQLARVILLEQLYRAHSILQGDPYHRE